MRTCDGYEENADFFLSRLRQEAAGKKIPFKGVFELTPRCNFNCNMCYVHLQPEQVGQYGRELSAEEWIAIGKEAQKAGMLELTLTGGEPFVRADFQEIYEKLHDMGFLIQIFSNGYLLEQQQLGWLKKRPPRYVRFTLYGCSDETYEAVCGIPGGFQKIKRSMEMLMEAGIPLYLVATITKENQHELGKMYSLAAKYGLPMTHTDNLINPVRGALADVGAHQVVWKLPSETVKEEIRKQDPQRFPKIPKEDFLDVCGNYKCGFWITWNGQMQLCSFLTEPSVHVEKPESFTDCWIKLLDVLEKEIRRPEECRECSFVQYCETCPGILYAQSGENGKISESVCRLAEFNYNIYAK